MSKTTYGASAFALRRSVALDRLIGSNFYKAAGLSLAGVAAAGTAVTVGSLSSSHHPKAGAAAPAIAPPVTTGVQAPPAPPPPSPGHPGLLMGGDSGPEVAWVQRALGVQADGVFGAKTRASVVDFQQGHGLTADGIVGPKTHATLAAPKTASAPKQATTSSSSTSTNTTGADAVVRWAFSEVGKPYSYGASGPSAFDCSGLTSFIFRQVNISLPRTSEAQFQTGKAVGSSNIKRGDLLFWDTDGSGASHVGVAISPTEAISAGTSEGVRVHPIRDGYWGSHFLGARSEF